MSDCWLLATLTSLAADDPESIYTLITPNNDDPLRFTVNLYDPATNQRKQDGVVVDFSDEDPDIWSMYSECNGIWVAVIEKALWDIGVKPTPNAPQAAIPYLTPFPGSVGWMWDRNPDDGTHRTGPTDDEIYDFLDNALHNDELPSPVIAGAVHLDWLDSEWGTDFAEWALDKYGIYQYHAYSVWDIGTDEKGNSWVELRDPYGYRSDTLWLDDGFVTLPFSDFVFIFTELGYYSFLDGPGGQANFDGSLDGVRRGVVTPETGLSDLRGRLDIRFSAASVVGA